MYSYSWVKKQFSSIYAAGPFGLLLACAGLSSCVHHAPPAPAASSVMAAKKPNWVKVRTNPPTFYPHGVPADCPTGPSDGEWVFTEDSQNTCYFIPFKGLRSGERETLLASALAARTPEKVRKIHDEDDSLRAKTWAGGVAGVLLHPVVIGSMEARNFWDYWRKRYGDDY